MAVRLLECTLETEHVTTTTKRLPEKLNGGRNRVSRHVFSRPLDCFHAIFTTYIFHDTKESTMESPTPREVKIQAALKELSEGKMTYAEASKAYGVGVGTLHGRMHGAKPQRQAHKAVQKLSPALEESIVHWILFEKLANRPPAKVMVHRYAQHVCDLSGIQTTLGRHWVDRFYFRHPEVNIKVGPSTDSKALGAMIQRRRSGSPGSEPPRSAARSEASIQNSGEPAARFMPRASGEHTSAS